MYKIRKKLREEWIISLLNEEWTPCDNFFYSDMQHALLVADIFLNIKTVDWIGVHPVPGKKLYGKPRTKIERLHRMRLREFNELKSCLRAWGKTEAEYWLSLKERSLLEEWITTGRGRIR